MFLQDAIANLRDTLRTCSPMKKKDQGTSIPTIVSHHDTRAHHYCPLVRKALNSQTVTGRRKLPVERRQRTPSDLSP